MIRRKRPACIRRRRIHLARVAVDPAGGRKTGVGTRKNLTGFWIMPDTGFSFEDAICNKQRREWNA